MAFTIPILKDINDMKYLDWTKLLQDSCPSCGFAMNEGDDKWICTNHKGKPFVISKEKFNKIVMDLDIEEERKLDWL